MRIGFTTGSCAAAAAKAAAVMLATGETVDRVDIRTPKGPVFHTEILEPKKTKNAASCGVRKDGGDDPDVTTGLIVRADVQALPDAPGEIQIVGGDGVGLVTKPGLDQPVGAYAINSGPRAAIERELRDAMKRCGIKYGLRVVVSIPGGEEVAKKTFNPRLGIVGGLSVLGTSGVVEPMSARAIVDTIRVELRQRRALGFKRVAIAPGNYGLDFMRDKFQFDLDRAVKCSNFIGETLDMVSEFGFVETLLCGHIGKLVKTSGGIMNTHSREADCRLELMACAALRAGADANLALRILDCVTTDDALALAKERGLVEKMVDDLVERIAFHVRKRADDRVNVEVIVFSNKLGLLGATKGAKDLVERIKEETRDEEQR